MRRHVDPHARSQPDCPLRQCRNQGATACEHDRWTMDEPGERACPAQNGSACDATASRPDDAPHRRARRSHYPWRGRIGPSGERNGRHATRRGCGDWPTTGRPMPSMLAYRRARTVEASSRRGDTGLTGATAKRGWHRQRRLQARRGAGTCPGDAASRKRETQELAGRGGFEPPRRYKRLPDFESGTFNHSATFPGGPRRTGGVHHTVPVARGQAARRGGPASARRRGAMNPACLAPRAAIA